MKETIHHPAEFYLQLIKDNKPFQLSRFGDGEALCMFHNGWLHENCDGSKFLDSLIEPMKQIFRNQYPYYHCLLDCSFDLSGNEFRQFLEETCPEMPFYDGEIWQHLSFSDRILELIDAISPHNPIFIGGKHLQKICYMKGAKYNYFIEVPEIDSFKSSEKTKARIKELYNLGHRFFGFMAGYSTKIWIDQIFPEMSDAFMIDFGSVFDPYCGKLSRDGMKFAGFSKFQPFTSLKLV